MISGADFYHVMTAMVPLYVAMIVAYASVRWWKIFTAEQCSGINRFVAVFAVPLLSFHFIASNDPYKMNLRFIGADTLQKLIVLGFLAVWANLSKRGCIEWTITLFSLSTLPNTLVMGIPLLKGMYGDFTASLMVQIVVLQCIIWYTLMLLMFEYRGGKRLLSDQFPDTAASIVSIHVESGVMSLDGRQPLETESEIKEDGKLHVTVRKSNARRSMGMGLRPSNLTNAEIYSLQSSRNPTPRGSSFNPANFYGLEEESANEPRHSNSTKAHYPAPKDLHMFVWSSNTSRISNYDSLDQHAKEVRSAVSPRKVEGERYKEEDYLERDDFSFGNTGGEGDNGGVKVGENKVKVMPPTSVMTRLILIMVWRKLIRNPNTYASLIGLIWSLVSSRWHVKMPAIIDKSISILSDAGLGMAMFSLGLFMASQKRIIACGYSDAAYSMCVKFLIGPAIMAAASAAVGLRGVLLRVAIVQAALPQAIVPFVFAKEYNVHADILSTGVIFGMLIAVPITLVYYILLEL